MSDLTRFRDHCRKMATAEHKDGCQEAEKDERQRWWMHRRFGGDWGQSGDAPPNPCPGCVTAADRALFAQLAAEVDDYLTPDPTLFEEAT